MFIASISLMREGYSSYLYHKPDPTKPFTCRIEVHGEDGKVELKLRPELSQRIINIIADEVAQAGRATAEAMVAAVIAAPVEATAIEDKTE